MDKDYEFRKYIKDFDEDLYNRIRGKCGGKVEKMIPNIMECLDKWATSTKDTEASEDTK